MLLQRGEIDPELREDLGVTDDQLKEFTKRLKQRLSDTGEDTSPEAEQRRRQFMETLKSLDFKSKGTARDGVEGPRENAAGFGGQRRKAPPRRRGATEAYQRRVNQKKESQK